MSKAIQEVQTQDPLVDDLVRRGRSEYTSKVVNLFQRLAGDRFQEAGRMAIEIMADKGVALERALADALDSLKPRSSKQTQPN